MPRTKGGGGASHACNRAAAWRHRRRGAMPGRHAATAGAGHGPRRAGGRVRRTFAGPQRLGRALVAEQRLADFMTSASFELIDSDQAFFFLPPLASIAAAVESTGHGEAGGGARVSRELCRGSGGHGAARRGSRRDTHPLCVMWCGVRVRVWERATASVPAKQPHPGGRWWFHFFGAPTRPPRQPHHPSRLSSHGPGLLPGRPTTGRGG